MKCPKCKFYNICKGRLNETVENCVRFKSVEQTNEEWFCSLPTEEKATFLVNYFMFDCPMVDKVFQKQEAHNFMGLEKLAKETILGWLKEKHSE